MSESSEQSRELMRRITAEIWDAGRVDLVDELIAEDLVDHIEVPGLELTTRERYRANVASFDGAAQPAAEGQPARPTPAFGI